jgi:TolB-like protein
MLTSLWLVAATLGAERPKLAVLDFLAQGVPAETAQALTTSATQELTTRGFFEVVTSADIQTLLGVERQKQLVGCSESASSCTAELAGAMGSRFVLSGNVTKLGETLQLSMQMLDTVKSQTVARSVRLAAGAQDLASQMPWALAEATATPLPPAPSKVLPISLISVGSASLVAGVVLGINAYTRDFALHDELAQPDSGVFKTTAFYQNEAKAIGTLKTVSLITVLSGAALLATGFLLFPSDGRTAVAVVVPVPSGLAFALAGVWP